MGHNYLQNLNSCAGLPASVRVHMQCSDTLQELYGAHDQDHMHGADQYMQELLFGRHKYMQELYGAHDQDHMHGADQYMQELLFGRHKYMQELYGAHDQDHMHGADEYL